MESFITNPEEFVALIRRDYDAFGKVLKDLKVSLY